ncbi:MAG: tripartite tricarboxylate transporter TctB family protein [Halomonas sp.]
MRIHDFILGLLTVLLGTITVWLSKDFPSLPRQDYGAGTFPTLVAVLLIAMGLILCLRGWIQKGPLIVWQDAIPIGHVLFCIMAVVAAVAGYILLTPTLGFPIVSLIMLTVLIGVFTKGRWWLAISVAAVATLIIWLTFAELLLVPLSLGILEEVIY